MYCKCRRKCLSSDDINRLIFLLCSAVKNKKYADMNVFFSAIEFGAVTKMCGPN